MHREQVRQSGGLTASPLFVALAYAFWGFLWISLSGRPAFSISHSASPLLSFLSAYKDWFYVTLTALASYRLLRRYAHMHAATLRQAERMLENSALRTEIILGAAKEGIFGLDVNGNISFINAAAARLLGYAEEELIARPSHQIFHHSRQDNSPYEEAECPIHAAYAEGKSYQVKNDVFWKKDGACFPVEYICTPFREQENLTGAVVVFSNISEEKKLEGRRRHAQKMESIGTLAGGIAHDFNNVLTAIIGCGKLLQMKIENSNPLSVYVDQILSAAAKAVGLTKGLLAFGRKQTLDPRPVGLNETVANAKTLLARLTGPEIELRVTLQDPELTVMADSMQLEQVLMNLATNARDAMPEGGIFAITTERTELGARFIKMYGYGAPGEYALISVSDTGAGIDGRIRDRIFEPFFTTKETGKGTGLGLSIVYGIVKQHNGYINVYSEPGNGATFKIYLPLADPAQKKTRSSLIISNIISPTGGTETVLVAEDDDAVRSTTKDILREFGYRVIEAADGEDAVCKFKENQDTIQLLLLDVVMPKKNGREAYEEIKAVKPGIRAIFTSGYTADIIHKKGVIDKELNFISKPVSPGKLLRKMRDVLDA